VKVKSPDSGSIAAPAGTTPDSENVRSCSGRSTSDAVAVNMIGVSSSPDCGPTESSTGATLTLPTVTIISSESTSAPSVTSTVNV